MSIDERLSKIESQISAIEVVLSILSLQSGTDMSKAFAEIMNTLGQFNSAQKDEAEFYNNLSRRVSNLRKVTGKEETSVTT